jgi:hypothetical protein
MPSVVSIAENAYWDVFAIFQMDDGDRFYVTVKQDLFRVTTGPDEANAKVVHESDEGDQFAVGLALCAMFPGNEGPDPDRKELRNPFISTMANVIWRCKDSAQVKEVLAHALPWISAKHH